MLISLTFLAFGTTFLIIQRKEADLLKFVKKFVKDKTIRAIIHKSGSFVLTLDSLRATVAFPGLSDAKNLVEKLSGKMILPPVISLPLFRKINLWSFMHTMKLVQGYCYQVWLTKLIK